MVAYSIRNDDIQSAQPFNTRFDHLHTIGKYPGILDIDREQYGLDSGTGGRERSHALHQHSLDFVFLLDLGCCLLGSLYIGHIVDRYVATLRRKLLCNQRSKAPKSTTSSRLDVKIYRLIVHLGYPQAPSYLEPPVTRTFLPFRVYGMVGDDFQSMTALLLAMIVFLDL